jgi:hypothetical protein
MKPLVPPILLIRLGPSLVCALFGLFLIDAISARPVPQDPAPSSASVADAARRAQERKSNPDSAKPTKVFTNDDLGAAPASAPAPTASATPGATPAPVVAGDTAAPVPPGETKALEKESAATAPSEAAKPEPICPNPNEEQIDGELQAAEEELDELRRELSADGPVISNGDVDMSNFKPGSSGVSLGSPPLLQATPQAPGRIKEVELEEKISALKEEARIACDSHQDAKIQEQLNSAESQLKLLQQQFNMDQSAYYAKPDYASDPTGKTKLDAEQQQIQALQGAVDRLREQLPSGSAGPAPE